MDPITIKLELDTTELRKLLHQAVRQEEAQRAAVTANERHDCSKALSACAGIVITPVEGYGTNVSWAISDLCRSVELLRLQIKSLRAYVGHTGRCRGHICSCGLTELLR